KPCEAKMNADFKEKDESLIKYLKGEEIDVPDNLKGFTLVSVEGVSLGFGKASNGRLKNKYPKGLRLL
ncbi:MAG: methylase, partial [Clostridia bacterium]|nr:methylase [Clostridia bacterium]